MLGELVLRPAPAIRHDRRVTGALRIRHARPRLVLGALVLVLLGALVFYMHGGSHHGDISLYHQYAQAFWLGSPPFHSLPAEYPLLALVPFTLTLLPPLSDFVTVFALWMLVVFVAGYLVISRRESPRVAEVCGVYLVLGCFATALGRFDLLPAAATVLAYWAARDRRFTLAYVLLAAGTVLKLYPVLLVPIVVLEHYRALGRNPLRDAPPRAALAGVALFTGAVVAVFAISAAIAPDGWLGPFTYNSRRPLQVESVPATLLWLSGFLGQHVAPDHSFHSYNLTGALSGELSLLAMLGLAGGCLLVYWLQLRGRLAFGRALTLCLLVIVCTDRVFSPQYLMWVMPMVAITERDYDGVWLAVCALTTMIFPNAYDLASLHGMATPKSYPAFFPALIALRNGLLVVAVVRYARRSLAAAASESRQRRMTEAPLARIR